MFQELFKTSVLSTKVFLTFIKHLKSCTSNLVPLTLYLKPCTSNLVTLTLYLKPCNSYLLPFSFPLQPLFLNLLRHPPFNNGLN